MPDDAPVESTSHGLEETFGFVPHIIDVRTHASHERLIDAVTSAGSISLDYAALNIFLRTNMFLNGATPFKEIRRYSPPPLFVPPCSLSRKAATEAYIDLFRQAVKRRANPDSVLALSGGCDSRHILLELRSQKCLPSCAVTVAIPGRPSEPEIAAELARRTGVRHIVVAPEASRAVEDELWKNCASDFMSVEHGWMSGVGQERDSLCWWDGIAGDVLSAGHFLEAWNLALFRGNRLDEFAERVVSERLPYFRENELFSRANALAEVRAELEKYQAAPSPVGSFYFWTRTRTTFAACAFGFLRPQRQTTLAPFLDRELWAFLASLPAEFLVDHRFHRDTVARACPDFAGIPFFKTKVKVSASIQYTKSLRLLWYLITGCKPSPQQIMTLLRIVRGVVQPRHIFDIDWLLAVSVYCTQVLELARRAKR